MGDTGDEEDVVELRFVPMGLRAGEHYGTIVFESPEAANSPVVVTVHLSVHAARDEVVVGLGPGGAPGGRWLVFPDGGAPGAPPLWQRLPWDAYDLACGETRPACGDLDGDARDEVVVGLGRSPRSGGFVGVFDDARGGFRLLRWLRVPWNAYAAANGETRPACGDLDGDGLDEVVVGLGAFPCDGGRLVVFDDARAGFPPLGWMRVPWSQYAAAGGETRPACGDLDGDGRDEVAVGLGRYPSAGGMVALFGRDVGPVFRGWVRFPSRAYCAANGETWPALGDLEGDGRDELVLGQGAWPGQGGSACVLSHAGGSTTVRAWLRLDWTAYVQANGEVRPACGDVDGDERDEVVLGTGAFAGGGRVRILEDATAGHAGLLWLGVPWAAYNAAGGPTRPCVGNLGLMPPPPANGGEVR